MKFSPANIAIAIVAFAAAAIAGGIGKGTVRWAMQEDNRAYAVIPSEEMIPFLKKISAKTNESLPRKIDDASVLVSTDAGPGREFTYRYSLPNHYTIDLDFGFFVKTMEQRLVEQACAYEGTSTFLKGNVSINYAYVDKGGMPLHTFTVKPADCIK